jgi:MFS family permease
VIPAGLLFTAAGLLVLTATTPTSGIWHLSSGVALVGAGMALVVAPASESLMTILPQEQTGVGSAVNDTVQELGGSLGVAVIGSLVSALYAHTVDASNLPSSVLHSPAPRLPPRTPPPISYPASRPRSPRPLTPPSARP